MSVTVKPTMAHLTTDPLRNFKFHVEIYNPSLQGILQLGFMSVSGLNLTTEIIPYRQGGFNTTTQKMPGQSDFSPITLSTGVAVGSRQPFDWMRQIFTVIQGTGTGASGQDFRSTLDIKILDHPVTRGNNVPVKAVFRVYNAWPTAVAFSDLDAGANALFIQQLTLAHEGFDMLLASQIGPAGDVSF